MPLSHKQILPAVVIVIDELCPPSRVAPRDGAEMRRSGHVLERAFGVPVQRVTLVSEVADEHVRPTVVVVILETYTHAGVGVPILVVGEPGSKSYLRERPVVVVAEKLLR